MDEDTKIIIVALAVLWPLAIACLCVICVTTVRFLRSQELADWPATGDLRAEAGKKGHRVSDTARMSI